MLAQAAQHAEARQHVQRAGRAGGLGQFRPAQQLLVNLPFLRGTEAIGNLDDIDTVNEGFVVLVILEILPFGLVGVRHDDPGEGNSANILRTARSAEPTSELQSLMRSSYAVFCL